jgi:hydroxymethylpyrimidine/phosphomethylpyrimidine kinase
MRKATVLVIAGSDSSGGAYAIPSFRCHHLDSGSKADMSQSGLEADQKVIAAHGCYAMTATTALTAQNTQGVDDIHLTPPDFVRKQIDACISDIGVDVVKLGLLLPYFHIPGANW